LRNIYIYIYIYIYYIIYKTLYMSYTDIKSSVNITEI